MKIELAKDLAKTLGKKPKIVFSVDEFVEAIEKANKDDFIIYLDNNVINFSNLREVVM